MSPLWAKALRALRRSGRFERGVLITLDDETRLYYRGEWCNPRFAVLLGRLPQFRINRGKVSAA